VLIAINKGMHSVKLCNNKILPLLAGVPANRLMCMMVVVVIS